MTTGQDHGWTSGRIEFIKTNDTMKGNYRSRCYGNFRSEFSSYRVQRRTFRRPVAIVVVFHFWIAILLRNVVVVVAPMGGCHGGGGGGCRRLACIFVVAVLGKIINVIGCDIFLLTTTQGRINPQLEQGLQRRFGGIRRSFHAQRRIRSGKREDDHLGLGSFVFFVSPDFGSGKLGSHPLRHPTIPSRLPFSPQPRFPPSISVEWLFFVNDSKNRNKRKKLLLPVKETATEKMKIQPKMEKQ